MDLLDSFWAALGWSLSYSRTKHIPGDPSWERSVLCSFAVWISLTRRACSFASLPCCFTGNSSALCAFARFSLLVLSFWRLGLRSGSLLFLREVFRFLRCQVGFRLKFSIFFVSRALLFEGMYRYFHAFCTNFEFSWFPFCFIQLCVFTADQEECIKVNFYLYS